MMKYLKIYVEVFNIESIELNYFNYKPNTKKLFKKNKYYQAKKMNFIRVTFVG